MPEHPPSSSAPPPSTPLLSARRWCFAGRSFLGFARHQMFKPEVRPFTIGGIVTFILLGSLSMGGSPEARADSKYLNPKKH